MLILCCSSKAIDKLIKVYKQSTVSNVFVYFTYLEPLRDWLYSIGSALAERVPDFQRLWDQELSSEVDEL